MRWIRPMHVLLSVLDLIAMDASDRRRLLSDLREVEAAAVGARSAEQRRSKKAEEVEDGEVVETIGSDFSGGESSGGEFSTSAAGPVADDV